MITVTRCYNQTKCKVFCELRNYYKMKRAQVVTPDFHCSSGSRALSPVQCSQGYPLSHEKHKTLLFTPSLPNYGPFSVFTFLSQKSQKELFFSVPSNALVISLICLFKFKLTQLKMKKTKTQLPGHTSRISSAREPHVASANTLYWPVDTVGGLCHHCQEFYWAVLVQTIIEQYNRSVQIHTAQIKIPTLTLMSWVNMEKSFPHHCKVCQDLPNSSLLPNPIVNSQASSYLTYQKYLTWLITFLKTFSLFSFQNTTFFYSSSLRTPLS